MEAVPNPRKAAARKLLTNSVLDHPPRLCWKRSQTQVKLESEKMGYVNERPKTQPSNKNLYPTTKNEDDNTLPTIQSNSSTMVSSQRMRTKNWSNRETKMKDLYNAVYLNGNNKPNKDIRISIQSLADSRLPSVRSSLPSVRLVIKATRVPLEEKHHIKLKPPTQRNKTVNDNQKDVSSSISDKLGDFEQPLILKRLDNLQQNSKDKTRKWLEESPLGLPEVTKDEGALWDQYGYQTRRNKCVRFEDGKWEDSLD